MYPRLIINENMDLPEKLCLNAKRHEIRENRKISEKALKNAHKLWKRGKNSVIVRSEAFSEKRWDQIGSHIFDGTKTSQILLGKRES